VVGRTWRIGGKDVAEVVGRTWRIRSHLKMASNPGSDGQDVATLAACTKSLLRQVQGIGDVLRQTLAELKLTQGNFDTFRQTTEAQSSAKQGLIDTMTGNLMCSMNSRFIRSMTSLKSCHLKCHLL